MKLLGIIAEYNPFHAGHAYHIQKSREILGTDGVICVMSGSFVQRGEPAVFDKWTRTRLALEGGADVVIELPELFSLKSAEGFATGGINILNALNSIDYLSFGCETDNLELLNEIASVLAEEPEDFKRILKGELTKGISFPKARANTLFKIIPECKEILSLPNCILALEYLKALKRTNSKILPFAVKRTGEYLSPDLNAEYPSAYAIRKALKHGKTVSENPCVFPEDMFSLIIYKLRTMSTEQISALPEVSEGLEFRIKAAVNAKSYDELIEQIKSKRFTETRIKRILMYSLLGITKEDMSISQISHVRVLGVRKASMNILSEISQHSSVPVVANPSNFKDDIFEKTSALASDIYGIPRAARANRNYTEKLIII